MDRMMGFLGMSIGGTIGWYLGDRIGFFTAFILSIVGTGAGLYLARRLIP